MWFSEAPQVILILSLSLPPTDTKGKEPKSSLDTENGWEKYKHWKPESRKKDGQQNASFPARSVL